MNRIELLLPARDLQCGKTAVNHGADAVYIGAPAFGARQAATNSLQDIEALVNYAHIYGAKVHVTVNTLVFDDEMEDVRILLQSLYNIGVDAVLIQDLGILKLDLPPLNFHASTQCHNHSLERIGFLQKLGFSRVVLARETDLKTIEYIKNNTDIELEAFVHGALCVSYSGQCYISEMLTSRSGNRGECAQICRTRFDLQDGQGNTIIADKHLLSLKDMCRVDFLERMMSAGISSFKVEGRLKNEYYVKNVTAFYRKSLDSILENNHSYRKSSSGQTRFFFTPDINKTFNRGFTPYFIDSERHEMASFDTPKAMGEKIGSLKNVNGKYFYSGTAEISNGDGLCFINKNNELEGFLVNNVVENEIFPQKRLSKFLDVTLYRNIDKKFEKILDGKTSERKIAIIVSVKVSQNSIHVSAIDEDEIEVIVEEAASFELAKQREKMNDVLSKSLRKTGDTPFEIRELKIENDYFIHTGLINNLKSRLLNKLEDERLAFFSAKDAILQYNPENLFKHIDYKANVTNEKHRGVYEDFGAQEVEYGLDKTKDFRGKTLMTCKYCLRYEMGWCSKVSGKCPPLPLRLVTNGRRLTLSFDCKNCLMKVENR